jgi:hypothetical protein
MGTRYYWVSGATNFVASAAGRPRRYARYLGLPVPSALTTRNNVSEPRRR